MDFSKLQIDFDKAMFRHRLLLWYRGNARALPWRVDWQDFSDPYRIWLSEIMLQQTVIKAVLPVYERFTKALPTLLDLAAASNEEVQRLTRGLGYYRRFALLKQAAELLAVQHCADGKVQWPTTYEGWLDLPGVGPYTAAAVSSIAFSAPVAVVDGNVERVLCRLFDIQKPPNLPPLKRHFQRLAGELVDPRHAGDFNQAVMELGQTICQVSDPACTLCPLKAFCRAFSRGTQALAPQAKIKTQSIDIDMQLYLGFVGGRVGFGRRPAAARFLRGTLGCLTVLKDGDGALRADGSAMPETLAAKGEYLGKIRHSITHHRIHAAVFLVKDKKKTYFDEWIDVQDADDRIISNLDRKAFRLLSKKIPTFEKVGSDDKL